MDDIVPAVPGSIQAAGTIVVYAALVRIVDLRDEMLYALGPNRIVGLRGSLSRGRRSGGSLRKGWGGSGCRRLSGGVLLWAAGQRDERGKA